MTSFQRKTGLGRGLSALLDDSESTHPPKQQVNAVSETEQIGNISHVSLTEVETNPYQPRTEFDQVALNELADSIKVQGLIQPITVRKLAANKYQLISGERRFRASKLAGLTQIPAYIRSANDQQMLEMALIENIQRENLNAIEVALSFQRMIDEVGLKQEQLGERVGKNRTTVTNYLRLLKLPPAIQASIRDQKISMGHARALINVDTIDKQLYIFHEIQDRDLSVRQTEELVRKLYKAAPAVKNGSKSSLSPAYKKIEDNLASHFSTKVKMQHNKKGYGSITLEYYSLEELNKILNQMGVSAD